MRIYLNPFSIKHPGFLVFLGNLNKKTVNVIYFKLSDKIIYFFSLSSFNLSLTFLDATQNDSFTTTKEQKNIIM